MEAIFLPLSLGVKEGRRSEEIRDGNVCELADDGEALGDGNPSDNCPTVTSSSSSLRLFLATGVWGSTSSACDDSAHLEPTSVAVSSIDLVVSELDLPCTVGGTETDASGRRISTGAMTEKCGIKALAM